ncbi:MAG: sulfotransferase [Cyanobacteria bacterium J06635_1]
MASLTSGDLLLPKNVHFISGLPRSGSTLLAAILAQNPRFWAGMTGPVGSLTNRLLEGMSHDETAVFISAEQKRTLLMGLFAAYYREQIEQQKIIFDTNRLWCSKLSLIGELFPRAKVISCVRNVAWVMDSLERLFRNNAFDISGLFNNRQEAATVYSRTETLAQGNRLVGFAYNALREAYYAPDAARMLLVEYDLLVQQPQATLALIYQFLEEPHFEHDFEQIEYDAAVFDRQLRTQGLHALRPKVEFKPRQTLLPPDLFEKYSQLSFWSDPKNTLAHVICAAADRVA